MSGRPTQIRVLMVAIFLTTLFDPLALTVLLHGIPVVFTVYMFLGQPLLLGALLLVLGAVLADLKGRRSL